jgi:macrodomain Ter protein organizer (MatP/YcbG family)
MKRETRSVKIDPILWKVAKKLAIDKDMTMSEFIEKLIDEAIKKQEK